MCHNVPVARTGWYEYLEREVTGSGDNIVKVYRSDEEVFSKSAMASFEGKPVTDDHPPEALTPDNTQIYMKGVTQNVRRSGKENDLLLADLVIHDKQLIDEIENGKREVSCGYEYTCVDNEDGTYSQTDIVGNHVAVVEEGRAGSRVSIKDSKEKVGGNKMSKIKIPRKGTTINKFLAAVGLKQYAIDAEPEELSSVVDEMAEEQAKDEESKEIKDSEEAKDEGGSAEIASLKEEIATLTALVKSMQAKDEEKPEEAIDNLISEIEGNDSDESETIESEDEGLPDAEVSSPEDRPDNPIPGADSNAWVKALKAMKPVIAAIPDSKQRQKACDSLMREYKKANRASKKNNYAAIMKSQKKKASDNKSNQNDMTEYYLSLGDKIAAKYNVNQRDRGGN